MLAVSVCGAWLSASSVASGYQFGPLNDDEEEEVLSGLELLRAADAALRDITAMSFTIHREGSGAQAIREPTTEARVVMMRRDDATRAGLQDES